MVFQLKSSLGVKNLGGLLTQEQTNFNLLWKWKWVYMEYHEFLNFFFPFWIDFKLFWIDINYYTKKRGCILFKLQVPLQTIVVCVLFCLTRIRRVTLVKVTNMNQEYVQGQIMLCLPTPTKILHSFQSTSNTHEF